MKKKRFVVYLPHDLKNGRLIQVKGDSNAVINDKDVVCALNQVFLACTNITEACGKGLLLAKGESVELRIGGDDPADALEARNLCFMLVAALADFLKKSTENIIQESGFDDSPHKQSLH